MKIIILNGSPKGSQSVTMQSVHYLEKCFPENHYTFFHIAQKIKKIETDPAYFETILSALEKADGIIWAFPVFHLLVHSHLKKFIELINGQGKADRLKDKYTAILTTSIHWFDHCAHKYMRAVCEDWDMKVVDSFSADMEDLLIPEKRAQLALFGQFFFNAIQNNTPAIKQHKPLDQVSLSYVPNLEKSKSPPDLLALNQTSSPKILILTDQTESQTNLIAMVKKVESLFPKTAKTINLHDIHIKGGCLSCYRCGYDNQCTYQNQDEFIEFFRQNLLSADILIFAASMVDRYLSSLWKIFFERMFFYRTNSPAFKSKQIAFLISGPFSQNSNLKDILSGFAQWQQANLVDIITDEHDDSENLDRIIEHFAQKLVHYAKAGYHKPQDFLGVGGMKIFRDNAWGRKRFLFQSDHKYYTSHGLYDFPQKEYGVRLKNMLLYPMLKISPIRKKFFSIAKSKLIEPHKKVLN